VATLEEVRQAVFPAAAAVGTVDPSRRDVIVGWVRVLRARVPAFDTLEVGDLVVVPASALAVVAPSTTERDDLIAAFAAAGVSAVLVTIGAEAGGDPADAAGSLAERAAAAGVPAYLVDGVDPGLLERSLIGFLVNRRGELELQAARLEERLQGLALERADLPALVAEIASFLGRAVALEGRRGDRLAVHANADDPAAAAAVARYLAGPATPALRVPLPAAADATAGTLLLLGDGRATELERIVGARIGSTLALELARDEAIRRARDTARQESLPSDGPPWLVLVARQVQAGDASTSEAREETRRDLRLLAPARRLSLRGTADSLELRAVLATADDDPAGLLLGARLAESLRRTVAISRPFGAPSARAAAEAEARATLEAVEAVAALDRGWQVPVVARADRLAAYRMLGALHNIPDGARIARSLLLPLMSGRPAVVRERLATLRAVLDNPGPAEAAASLGVHRNTLAYRVRRIEALSGWRLSDPTLRLPLSAAVRLVQDAQRGPGDDLA
jgi:hypothetical protein